MGRKRETHWEGGRDTDYLQELSQARHTGHAALGKYTQGEQEFTGRLTDKIKAWGSFGGRKS
jgi:hypothetical protein